MLMRRLLAAFCAGLVLSSCSSLAPIAPEPSDAEVQAKGDDPNSTATDLAAAKRLLSGWRKEYAGAGSVRKAWDVGFAEALFYGSVSAVLFGLTGHDRARNLGITIAAGSGLLDSHYQTGAQVNAFRKAVKKLDCMKEATMQITPADEVQFTDLKQAQKDVLIELPSRIVHRINKVRSELGDTLHGIELAAPTKDQIADMFQKWLAAKSNVPTTPLSAKEAAVGKPTGLVDPAVLAARQAALELRKARFEAALAKVNQELEVCVTGAGG